MIQFKKLTIHNFGSYGHVELDLQNRGFCLVSGQNNYIKDNALSNGAGKSFLWSAICYALTGETLNGIRSNLKNINVTETDCYVQLEFLYNKDLFCLTRAAAPKTDLKIFKNDIDLSGKGIRESDKKLQELLPDLNKDLIASTIIIGQGMPNKFSSFSPSGRKELLEKLTKSDFMIEDLKARISARQQELSSKVRELEDSLLANNTQLNLHTSNLNTLKESLAQQVRPDFNGLIEEYNRQLLDLQQQIQRYETEITANEQRLEIVNAKLLQISEEKAEVSAKELVAYTKSRQSLTEEKTQLNFNISGLQKEINKLKAITDICPTCGQKLPNVYKPSTEQQEQQLETNKQALTKVLSELEQCDLKHAAYLQQIDSAFADELSALTSEVTTLKNATNKAKIDYNKNRTALDDVKSLQSKVIYDQQNWDKRIANQEANKANLEAEIVRLNNLISIINTAKVDYVNRLSIVKKMDTLIRRDFRGYLLTNIISYINTRAKQFCNIVFGTKELTLSLNGNALDITYCGKMFDSLSGGEKQRVDLILQLAIRDVLASYLDLSANILVLDEITDFLDKKSCKAVMQLLEQELRTVESVFIVSHHAEELELPIDSELKVIKNEFGISELY